jgi:hypothetical protein
MVHQCYDCDHEHICKYKEDYEKTASELNVKVKEPFTLALICPNHTCTKTYLSGLCKDYNSTSNGYSSFTEARTPGGETFVY